MLITCQAGYEEHLERELAARGSPPAVTAPGRVLAAPGMQATGDLCFAHAQYIAPVDIRAGSVNGMAGRLLDWFLQASRGERFDTEWPFLAECAPGLDGLGRRSVVVQKAFIEALRRRMSRVARLAHAAKPAGAGQYRGLFLYFADYDNLCASRECCLGGQRRMSDDDAAPSRSYLKVEEAYGVLGAEPAAGETVVDLGAAPGGWSYSAAKRGARVIAVDNGPLKGGALGHPNIEHLKVDAFGFRPEAGAPAAWLFCDLVEDPHHVLGDIVEPWLRDRLCRRFIVNLKFGRADAVALLEETRRRLQPHCAQLVIRHLYHDREEFTLAGETLKR